MPQCLQSMENNRNINLYIANNLRVILTFQRGYYGKTHPGKDNEESELKIRFNFKKKPEEESSEKERDKPMRGNQ